MELLNSSAKDVDKQETSAGLVDVDLRPVINTVFGENADRAYRYHSWLAEEAIVRGLIRPRETPKPWDRHIINSAVVGEAIGKGLVVADIGSGVGLSGIPPAFARPDLKVVLVEPLLRHTTFLNEVMRDLELGNVTVVCGRAKEKAVRAGVGQADVVTSRAITPLGKLTGWLLPLVKFGGAMVALKGGTAQEEINRDAKFIAKTKGINPYVVGVGGFVLGTSTYAVIIQKK